MTRKPVILPVALVTAGLAFVAVAGLGVGCLPQPTVPATPTRTPDVGSASLAVSVTASPPVMPPTGLPAPTDQPTTATESTSTETPTLSVTLTPSVTLPPPTIDTSLPPEHYLLLRPIPVGAGYVDYVDRNYAYGATSGGQYRPHTGVEFWNSAGTPVIAVGNGVVEYAGTDEAALYGPQANFYGNLIVLQLTDYSYAGQPVYVLYGHLSQINVTTGQTVIPRDVIGAVGVTGVAIGPHLHFEVRIGSPQDYFTSTRNPDLWIKPYWGYGTLAGRVTDSSGAMLRNVSITATGPDAARYTWTYAGDENIPDEQWQENFTLGDLPEGWYTITTRSTRTHTAEVYIQNGHTTWLEFIFD